MQADDWIGKKNKDGTYTPVWDRNVTSAAGVKGDDVYIGKEKTYTATDNKTYHLGNDGKAKEIQQEKPTSQKTEANKSPENLEPSTGPDAQTRPGIPFPIASSRPDYLQLTLSFGPQGAKNGGTATLSITLDRDGVLYLSGGFSSSLPAGEGASLSVNYVDNSDGSKNQLNNFLTGGSITFGGGIGLGLQRTHSTDSSNKTTSTGWMVTTPTVNVGYSNSPAKLQIKTGISW